MRGGEVRQVRVNKGGDLDKSRGNKENGEEEVRKITKGKIGEVSE